MTGYTAVILFLFSLAAMGTRYLLVHSDQPHPTDVSPTPVTTRTADTVTVDALACPRCGAKTVVPILYIVSSYQGRKDGLAQEKGRPVYWRSYKDGAPLYNAHCQTCGYEWEVPDKDFRRLNPFDSATPAWNRPWHERWGLGRAQLQ